MIECSLDILRDKHNSLVGSTVYLPIDPTKNSKGAVLAEYIILNIVYTTFVCRGFQGRGNIQDLQEVKILVESVDEFKEKRTVSNMDLFLDKEEALRHQRNRIENILDTLKNKTNVYEKVLLELKEGKRI